LELEYSPTPAAVTRRTTYSQRLDFYVENVAAFEDLPNYYKDWK
jgi:hypothetical protein